MERFRLGALLIYVGFFIFLAGFMVSTTANPTLDDLIRTVIPLDLTSALKGAIIQILAGVVGVTGLLLCIASVSKPIPPPITIVQKAPEHALAPVSLPAQSPTQKSLPAQSGACKYCGHYLEPNEPFCPTCDRAQK